MERKQSDNSTDLQADNVKKTESMNEELKQWLQESKQYSKPSKKIGTVSKTDKKKPLGKCQICGKREAKAICVTCGKPACTACYFHLMGLCKKCLEKNTGDKWKGIKPDWEKTLGVDWLD